MELQNGLCDEGGPRENQLMKENQSGLLVTKMIMMMAMDDNLR